MNKQFKHVDPADLMKLSDLQLLARTVVEGSFSGMHRSPLHGSSIEFAQYRPYVQGDDLRHVDWTLYGRSDRLHVKMFHEETSLQCTILLDCSASMNYGSGAVSKFHYARMLAACLTMMLYKQNDAFGLVTYHHDVFKHLNPKASPQQLYNVLTTLDTLQPEGRTDTDKSLAYLGNVLKPRGMVILISDLLHPLDEMLKHLKSLRARRHDVLVLQIADVAEQTFPFDRTITLVDAESSNEQYVVPDSVRKEYLENRRNHFSVIQRECRAAEIDIEEFVTTEPLDRALHHFMYRRNHALYSSSVNKNMAAGGV
jgi:uncharacterized protein (DUF58 family)